MVPHRKSHMATVTQSTAMTRKIPKTPPNKDQSVKTPSKSGPTAGSKLTGSPTTPNVGTAKGNNGNTQGTTKSLSGGARVKSILKQSTDRQPLRHDRRRAPPPILAPVFHEPPILFPVKTSTNKITDRDVSEASLEAPISIDPLRWFREDKLVHKNVPQSLSKNPVKYHIGPYEPRGILDTVGDEKMITVGGYIINIEKELHGLTAIVQPKISSNSGGIEVEVRIGNCDPGSIQFEKRYNAILVIGVKVDPTGQTQQETPQPGNNKTRQHGSSGPSPFQQRQINLEEIHLSPQEDDDMIEVINLFVPRDVSLAKVIVSEPDTRGRIFIRAP